MHSPPNTTSTNQPSSRTVTAAKRIQKTRDEMHCEQRRRIEPIRANNLVEQIIGRYVELRPNGRWLVGHCPFHNDPTPNFVVYVNTQSWFCFGCDVGGDVFKYVELIEEIPFREALEKLNSGTIAARPIPHVPTVQQKSVPAIELSEEHLMLLTAGAEVYHAAIFAQAAMLEYLARRRIDLDMMRRHRIGYATGSDLAKYLRFRGWDSNIAQDLGLAGPRGEFFRQRIIIPEIRGGKMIYLVGRKTPAYQKAKYLGLPGAPKPLYGAELIRGESDVLMAEGAFDWLTLIEWGYPVVALLGSHLKQDQIGEIASAERIFIATESDEAGRKSARQLAELFGKRARIVPPLPNAKDVNELAMRPRAREIFAGLV